MKTRLTISILFWYFLLGVSSTYATHYCGGQITYKWISGDQYMITASVYVECGPWPNQFKTSPTDTINIHLVSQCGNNILAKAIKVKTELLTPPCPGTSTACDSPAGVSPAIFRQDYQLTYTFPNKCSDWTIYYSLSTRVTYITTFASSGHDLVVSAHLNNLVASHDSPEFNFEPTFFYCVNNSNAINLSLKSTTDSLSFSFVAPQISFGTPVAYNPGYDSVHFFTGTSSFDSKSGLLTVTPTASGQIASAAVLIKQYRNKVLIGSIMRDFICNIISCSNPNLPPSLTGINGTSLFSITIPPNKTTCFNLHSSCADTSQATKLSWDTAIAGASFIPYNFKNQQGKFCWTPTLADTGSNPHCFTVSVTNNSICPMYNHRYYTYCVYVKENCSVGLTSSFSNPSCPGANDGIAQVLPNSGTPPYQYSWNNGATTDSLLGLAPGTYFVSVADSVGCKSIQDFQLYNVIPYCIYNIVRGYCFYDLNVNGIRDAGESAASNLLVSSKGSVNSFSSATDTLGNFLNYVVDTGSVITSIQSAMPPYYTYTPLQFISNHSTYFNTDTTNFALIPAPGVQDLRISLVTLHGARPGYWVKYRLVYSNVGSTIIPSGIVYLIKDSHLSVSTATPAYTSVVGDSITWTYSNLAPNETRNIDIVLPVPLPPTINIGDIVSSYAVIEPVATDSVKPDNYSGLNKITVSPYDPNDKTMLGGQTFTTDQISNGEYFTYIIRFQNTGTDTAYRVVVRDTLDSKLDPSTMGMISSSHNCNLSIQNNYDIAWAFDNIMLPDSGVNELQSHGYIYYKIKPKSTVKAGDIIKNKADIYFDFNPAITTNTAITTISFLEATNNKSNSATNFNLFPNPVTDELNISFAHPLNENGEIVITDILGKELARYRLDANKNIQHLKLPNLSQGIYLARLTAGNQSANVKFVVE